MRVAKISIVTYSLIYCIKKDLVIIVLKVDVVLSPRKVYTTT